MARVDKGANRPCPCGSGRKYRLCCREKVRAQRREILSHAPSAVGPRGEKILLLDLEEGERLHEQGLSLVQRGRGREAIPVLERCIEKVPLIPNPHNNLALAHFHAGDPDRAIETAEHVVRVIDPGNTFARAILVHFYMVVGRTRDAERMGDGLRTSRPESVDAAVRVCEALPARIAFLRGTAAANLEDHALAGEYLRQAARDPAHRKRARKYLGLLERHCGPGTLQGDWPYFEALEWMPYTCLERLGTEPRLRSYPGVVFSLVGILNEAPARGELTVRFLGEIASPQALEILRQVAFGTFGTDDLRFTALSVLRELGEIKKNERVRIWRSGEWTTVECTKVEITEEAATPVPAHVEKLAEEVVSTLHSGDHVRAELRGRALVARAPDYPAAHQNLAVALYAQGKTEEAEAHLRRAMEMDPQYLFAPAALARIRLQQHRIAEAREILRSTELPPRIHPDAYAVFLSAQKEVALAEGKTEAAAMIDQALRRFPGQRRTRPAWGSLAMRLWLGFQSILAARKQRRARKNR